MAKFRFSVSTGYAGSDRSQIVEIPDEFLQDLCCCRLRLKITTKITVNKRIEQ